jgi:hypothetical protein
VIRTWHVEAAGVAVVLATVTLATGARAVEWIGSLAVLASFMHGQVADRLAEREAARSSPDVHCHRWAGRYFAAKEALWLVYFVVHRSYAALAGVALFLAYPLWRRWWRS